MRACGNLRIGKNHERASEGLGFRDPTTNSSSMKHGFRVIIILSLLFAVALGSSVVDGPPVEGVVTRAELSEPKNQKWKLSIELLDDPKVVPSGFYKASDYKKGAVVRTEVFRPSSPIKKGDKVKVRWKSYSGMGPNGPVGGLSWELLERR